MAMGRSVLLEVLAKLNDKDTMEYVCSMEGVDVSAPVG
jgi:hypothetical protein